MKCWICGESANSGEHKAKASDVRSVFGTPTQDAPINLRTNIDGNQKLIGVNVDELKWTNKICSNCNNAISSPYDKAWERFSVYLQEHPNGLDAINLKKIYGKDVTREVLNLYLYFAKQFGCYINNANVDIDLRYFSSSLLKAEVHPDFYLRCSYFRDWPIQKMIQLTELQVACDKYGPYCAIAGYAVGAWCIDMAYWIPRIESPPIVKTGFQPTRVGETLKVHFPN